MFSIFVRFNDVDGIDAADDDDEDDEGTGDVFIIGDLRIGLLAELISLSSMLLLSSFESILIGHFATAHSNIENDDFNNLSAT